MTKEEKRQLLMIIDKVFIEQKINAYTNKRDGWIPESQEYAAYDLVIREYKCVMSQLMPLSTLPDEGEKADKVKYTKDDMRQCFKESRLTHPMVGFKHDTFELYIDSLNNQTP